MVILSSPAAVLLVLAAVLLTLTGIHIKKGLVLTYVGGFLWAAGTLAALYAGAPLRELLPVTLLLLTVSALPGREEGTK